MEANKRLILCLFGGLGGFHLGAWRMPGRDADLRQSFEIFKWTAQTAERGKLHALFLLDKLWVTPSLGDTPAGSMHHPLDPISLMSALSQCTERIGLVVSRNTTYSEPYQVAREFATLDEISGGRVAWNVVTGGGVEAPNFGDATAVPHDLRYERAEEFVDAVKGLWDSWDEDAFTYDKQTGVYWDKDKVHQLDFVGKHVRTRGPITVLRPPQGHPVLAQAGTSPKGIGLAGRIGEMIFAVPTSLEHAQSTRAQLRAVAEQSGRDPDHCKFIPDIHLLIAATQSEADERLAELDERVDPMTAIPELSRLVGIDLAELDIDGPLPDEIPVTDGFQSWQRHYIGMARSENLSIRQLARRFVQFPSPVVAGTPESIADTMQEWLEADAVDGFMCRPSQLRAVEDIVDSLVPELRRRGIFRSEYEGATLRENLGLPRPASRYERVGSEA